MPKKVTLTKGSGYPPPEAQQVYMFPAIPRLVSVTDTPVIC